VIERIDQREGGCTIESSAIVQGGCDADRCLVDIWNTKIDFPHDGVVPQIAVRKGFVVVSGGSAADQK
jgi:multidrug resistance efflux pump